MPRPKKAPYIYKRPGYAMWFAYLNRNRRHISLKTENESEALVRLAALTAEAPREMNRDPKAYRELMSGPVLYFIKDGLAGNVKIGRTDNLRARLQTLQTAHANRLVILGVVKDEHRIEKQIHALFTKEHIEGEWFRPSLELLKFISLHTTRPR